MSAVALAGCSDDPEPAVSPAPGGSPSAVATPTAAGEPTEFPGTPFGRAVAGASYVVVGVAHDDTLNLRSGPSADFAVVAWLGPTDAAVATGDDRLHQAGLWLELDTPGGVGWANSSFLALAGGTSDVTSQVVAANGGGVPVAETMEDLGLLVADFRKSDDPPSSIVIVVAPTGGDVSEITVDVIGLGDDAVLGERLHVFGTADGEGFTLDSVEATVLCGRGVDGGSCV